MYHLTALVTLLVQKAVWRRVPRSVPNLARVVRQGG